MRYLLSPQKLFIQKFFSHFHHGWPAVQTAEGIARVQFLKPRFMSFLEQKFGNGEKVRRIRRTVVLAIFIIFLKIIDYRGQVSYFPKHRATVK